MFTISLDSSSHMPLYEQIYQYIKKEILSGTLRSGDKLPSARSLSEFLSVSRNTVDIAYDQLVSEGYIDSLPRKGYYISNITHTQTFSSIPSNMEPILDVENKSFAYDFSPDYVDLEHFPFTTWRRLSRECMHDTQLFSLGENQGDRSFRQAISTYLHGSRGVNCNSDQIIIGAGVDYLLQLLAVILDRTAPVCMEDPAYKRARHIFKTSGFLIVDAPVDHDGICVDQLSTSSASVCYVTPSHQFPLGCVMPVTRRQQLLSWANESADRFIIEDDHDSEFRYKGKPIPSLQGIDTNDKVVYIGTFSKAIAPAIRIGYMVLPKSLLTEYKKKCPYYACTVSRIDQALLTQFIDDGLFEKHLNRMRKIYRVKHDLALSILRQYDIEISGENAGLYLVIHINQEKENALIERASKIGIKLYGLKQYYTKPPVPYKPGFLLGFAGLSEEKLQTGLTLLCEKVLS